MGRDPHRVAPHYGVRTDEHKLVYFYETDEWELYDLVADPDELHSVAEDRAYAEVFELLKAELVRLREQYGDQTGTEPG